MIKQKLSIILSRRDSSSISSFRPNGNDINYTHLLHSQLLRCWEEVFLRKLLEVLAKKDKGSLLHPKKHVAAEGRALAVVHFVLVTRKQRNAWSISCARNHLTMISLRFIREM